VRRRPRAGSVALAMAPEQRVIPRFAAEPPQEELPYGRWRERLEELLVTQLAETVTGDADLGALGEIVFYPDRTWHGRTYVPATAPTDGGFEVFGYVRFVAGDSGEPSELSAYVDFTDETAARNPQWKLDLCEEAIGLWRGPEGSRATMTLVWGHPLVTGGRVATAEMGGITVDQCELVAERFTLIAPDDFRGDLLEVKLFGARGQELASESLYDGDGEGDEEEEPADGDAREERAERGGASADEEDEPSG
jgi:hypothetical protein